MEENIIMLEDENGNAVEFEASTANQNFSAFFLKGFQMVSDLFVFCWKFLANYNTRSFWIHFACIGSFEFKNNF